MNEKEIAIIEDLINDLTDKISRPEYAILMFGEMAGHFALVSQMTKDCAINKNHPELVEEAKLWKKISEKTERIAEYIEKQTL